MAGFLNSPKNEISWAFVLLAVALTWSHQEKADGVKDHGLKYLLIAHVYTNWNELIQ